MKNHLKFKHPSINPNENSTSATIDTVFKRHTSMAEFHASKKITDTDKLRQGIHYFKSKLYHEISFYPIVTIYTPLESSSYGKFTELYMKAYTRNIGPEIVT